MPKNEGGIAIKFEIIEHVHLAQIKHFCQLYIQAQLNTLMHRFTRIDRTQRRAGDGIHPGKQFIAYMRPIQRHIPFGYPKMPPAADFKCDCTLRFRKNR